MFSKDPYLKKAAKTAKLTPEEELFMVIAPVGTRYIPGWGGAA